MTKSLHQRLTEALDVSGAFDNCFFHSFSLHLLANKLDFPEDLFTFKSVIGENSSASELQKRFSNIDSLSLFADHAKVIHSDKAPVSPEFIVEKTLVLGFLMREWFATTMSNSSDIRDELQKDALIKFIAYKDFFAFVNKEDLLSGPEGVLYSANEKFLTYFSTRPKEALTPEESHFEQYFIEANDDANKALAAFWKAEGYQNYCKLLASPRQRLAPNDFIPIIQSLNQSLTIYNGDQGIIQRNVGNNDMPTMEVKLDVKEAHYYLLKTEETTSLLDEYDNSFKQYKADRDAVLAVVGDKVLAAATKSSLFVGAICRPEHLTREPFTLLLEKVDTLKSEISEHQKAQAIKKQQEKAEQEQQNKLTQQEKEKPHVPNEYEHAINEKLKLLTIKIAQFAGKPEYKTIYDALNKLHSALTKEVKTYFGQPPSEDRLDAFKNNCNKHILAARPEIDKHRGWSKIIANIAAFIFSAGVGYLLAAGVNMALNKGRFTFFSTDRSLIVNEFEDSVNNVKKP